MILEPFIVPLGSGLLALVLISFILIRKKEKLRLDQKLLVLGLFLCVVSLLALVVLLNRASTTAPRNSEGIMVLSTQQNIELGVVLALMFLGPVLVGFSRFLHARQARVARAEHSEIVKVISSEYEVDDAVEIIERAGHNRKLKADTDPI